MHEEHEHTFELRPGLRCDLYAPEGLCSVCHKPAEYFPVRLIGTHGTTEVKVRVCGDCN